MAWIKRNLFFVITAVIGLGVTGYCGFLLYSALGDNSAVNDEYTSTVSSLEELQKKSPYPNKDNIQSAKADQERVRAFLSEFRKAFSPFPVPAKVDDRGFKDHLQRTIYQWGLDASNAGVLLPPNYAFGFSEQIDKLNYSPECIAPWMQQLEEIRVILRILFQAKINFLENVQRCPICQDDGGGQDYVYTSSTTNSWYVATPYKIIFRGFSTEVANVLAGFAGASNCFIVKDIDIDRSVAPLPQIVAPAQAPQPTFMPPPRREREMNPFMLNNGEEGGRGTRRDYQEYRRRPMQPAQAAAPPEAAGPETILTENLLFVTLSVDVVKLK
jgi:hypothetical protein